MISSQVLLDISIILLFTKIFGLITKKYRLTQVLGALIAGIVLGPTGVNLLHEGHFIEQMAEIGLIIIVFLAGLETDLKKLKTVGKTSFAVGALGVLFPVLGCVGLILFFDINSVESLFIGVILSTTSVSITVETLMELGKLKNPLGITILGSAVIDDIIGIIILTFLMGRIDAHSTSFMITLFNILGFLAFVVASGVIFNYAFNWLSIREGKKRRLPLLGLSYCFLLAYIAGRFGVPDIAAAYIAGLAISNTVLSHYIESKIEVLSYMFFAPMHFAFIGMNIVIGIIDRDILVFTAALLLIAVFTKIGGCTIGGMISGLNKKDSFHVGIGMICRAEFALIITNRAVRFGAISAQFFTPIIIVIIVTTIVTPLLLKTIIKQNE